MNYVHDSFLSEGNDDYISSTYIGVDDKYCLIRTLIRNAKRVLADIHANPLEPSGDYTKDRLIWLMVTMGDLSGRLDREAYMLDGEQYRQVYEYLEGMLEVCFTAEERASPIVFQNAWNFTRVIDLRYRTFVHPDNARLQPELDMLWKEYDDLLVTIRGSMDPLTQPWAVRFEDFFFERGLATAKNDIRSIKKCFEPYARKNYAFARGEERFHKLFKFHGQRPELLEQFVLFQDLMVRYVPEYLADTSKRLAAVGPKGFIPNRERVEEVVRNAPKTLEHVRNVYVKTEAHKLLFDKLCESMNISNL